MNYPIGFEEIGINYQCFDIYDGFYICDWFIKRI